MAWLVYRAIDGNGTKKNPEKMEKNRLTLLSQFAKMQILTSAFARHLESAC